MIIFQSPSRIAHSSTDHPRTAYRYRGYQRFLAFLKPCPSGAELKTDRRRYDSSEVSLKSIMLTSAMATSQDHIPACPFRPSPWNVCLPYLMIAGTRMPPSPQVALRTALAQHRRFPRPGSARIPTRFTRDRPLSPVKMTMVLSSSLHRLTLIQHFTDLLCHPCSRYWRNTAGAAPRFVCPVAAEQIRCQSCSRSCTANIIKVFYDASGLRTSVKRDI